MAERFLEFSLEPLQELVPLIHKGVPGHIFFIAETKGTMETLNLKPIEKAKIDCAKKLFAELSSADVVYDSVDSYQHLLDIMESL